MPPLWYPFSSISSVFFDLICLPLFLPFLFLVRLLFKPFLPFFQSLPQGLELWVSGLKKAWQVTKQYVQYELNFERENYAFIYVQVCVCTDKTLKGTYNVRWFGFFFLDYVQFPPPQPSSPPLLSFLLFPSSCFHILYNAMHSSLFCKEHLHCNECNI